MNHSFRRHFVSFLLILVLLLQLIPTAFAADRFATSLDPLNYVDFDVDGGTLTVHGRIRYAGLTHVLARCGGSQGIVEVADGEAFTVYLAPTVTDTPASVEVYVTTGGGTGTYQGYIWSSVFLVNDGGELRFLDSPVLPHNRVQRDRWNNPAEFLELTDRTQRERDQIRRASATIVGTETDDYEKIRLLYRWVAENIYYNYEYYADHTASLTWMPAEVLLSRRSVCEGYARLLTDLIRAQGIPAMCVYCAVLDPTSEGAFTEADANISEPNHMYVEAFADGRWICMDPTWDSGNAYKGGRFVTGAATWEYFDVTPESLAWTHKVFDYCGSAPKDTPSDWAREETLGALGADLVPDFYQSDYRRNCSRVEFCYLAMQLVCRVSGADSVQALAASRGLELTGDFFTDSSDPTVELAGRLGIVNGIGNGQFAASREITRQEAAAMLNRTAKLLGLAPTGAPIPFTDADAADSWAKCDVADVSSLVTPSGRQVMGGVGGGLFAPKGSYTREQSILTMYRLYLIAAAN